MDEKVSIIYGLEWMIETRCDKLEAKFEYLNFVQGQVPL